MEFITPARKEVIELGEKLNTFSANFTTEKDKDFKDHIKQLLKSGINIKCIICDPDSESVISYSKHIVDPTNTLSITEIKESISRLTKIREELLNKLNIRII